MRKGWKYKKLGEVATYINGYAFKPDQWKESGTPIVRIQNLNNENAPYNYYDGEVPDKVKIQNGDLLISWSASLGAYIWHGGNAFLNQHIFKVAFDKTDIDKFFLKYAVTSKLAAMAEQVHGATMKHIVKKDFDNTQIPYPPLSTQLAIVSELDKINELIRLKKEQLKDFDNLAQSLFYEMFGDPVENEKGWEVKKIGDLALVKTGPFGSMLHKEDYICDGIPLVNPVHMKDFKIVPDLDFTISKEKASELENYLLKSNDVVFARRGDIGRCAIVSEAEQGFICGTGSLFVRFSKEIESIFIMYIIRCDSFSKHLISKAKGATMLNINSNTIADLRIPPPTPPSPASLCPAHRANRAREIGGSEVHPGSRNPAGFPHAILVRIGAAGRPAP